MFRRFLIAVDRSEPAEYAANAGMELATKLGATVVLLTVIPPTPFLIANVAAADAELDESWHGAKGLLAHCRSRLPDTAQVDEVILEGSPGNTIVQAAATYHADLIILGTHNRHGLSRVLLGSTAEAVARRAPCAVMIVRQPDAQPTQAVDELVTSR